jgi:DNA-binding SARP family transcriptional activator/tetratricopeptide (TPR) repeat protein
MQSTIGGWEPDTRRPRMCPGAPPALPERLVTAWFAGMHDNEQIERGAGAKSAGGRLGTSRVVQEDRSHERVGLGLGGCVHNAPDNMIQIEVLGPLRALTGEQEITLGPSRQRAVFAVLAANANRVVNKDELVDAVWGESSPASASGSVHTYISGLRRALGGSEVLTTVPSGYQLRLPVWALDSANFTRLRSDAQQLLADGDRGGAVAVLDKALGLWTGSEAYAGVPGPFAELDRARLAELRLSTIELRARALLDLGGHGELVAELATLVHDHPLNETLHELLMLSLYRSGRTADALEAFTAARRTLVQELGVEPGQALRKLHGQILGGSVIQAPEPVPVSHPPVLMLPRLATMPARVTRALRESPDEHPFVGRQAEVELLRELVRRVAAGSGRSVWIDGDPGIGKSELLTVALAHAGQAGCQIAWSVADELGQRVPLQVILEALGLETTSSDPRLAALAEKLHGDSADDAGPALAEGVLGFVREACQAGPLILVIDDMQWADEASLLVWGRLTAATRRLPLLLVAASRPEWHRKELSQLRRGIEARDGHVFALEPLSRPDVESLIGQMVGALPGESLRALVLRTAGNPLYAREMTSALVRQSAVHVVNGFAEVDLAAADTAPDTLIAAVRSTLEFLTPDTKEVLRLAALLGMEFTAADVVALTGRSPIDLVRTFQEAVDAHVVVDAGAQLAFRHPFLRQALADGVPLSLRATLRRHAAEALANAGSPVTRVAEQLAAETTVIDAWVAGWVAEHHYEIARRAPLIAADLLRLTLDSTIPTTAQRELLLIEQVKLLFRLDLFPEAEARRAITVAKDPYDLAEMRQLLAAIRFRKGDTETAIQVLGESLADPSIPPIWRTRHRVLMANFRRGDLSDVDQSEYTAQRVLAEATALGQTYEAASALQTMWLLDSIRRDHERALGHLDRALELVADDPDSASLHYDLLDNRVFSLQNLDRLDEAQATLRSAAEVAARRGLPGTLRMASVVQAYWLGRWDDALLEASAVTKDGSGISFFGMREPAAVAMLLHGVAALIAGRRGDLPTATAHLDAAEAQLPSTSSERESCDFLLVAKALVAEQRGEFDEALAILAPLRQPSYAPMMLRHQWLGDIVRLAIAAGRTEIAHEALAICAEEEDKETFPARAFAAAARCRAQLDGDPEPALAAAAHYRAVGRVPELAAALEDAAALLAATGRGTEAAAASAEAMTLLRTMSAAWDIGRLQRRLAAVAVTATVHHSSSRPTTPRR